MHKPAKSWRFTSRRNWKASKLAADWPTKSSKTVTFTIVEDPPASQVPIHRTLGTRLVDVADYAFLQGGKKAFNSLKSGALSTGFPSDAMTNAHADPHAIVQVLERAGLGIDDIVLIKGHSTQHLERVALLLAGKMVTCSIRFLLKTP